MRVLYVLTGASLGGVETGLLTLLQHLDPDRVQATVVTLAREPIGRVFRQQGIHSRCAPPGNRLGYLCRLIRRKKIDLVQSFYAAMEGALAARQAGVPHLWYIGGKLNPSLPYPSPRTLAPLRLALAHFGGEIVVPSRALVPEFRDLPASKIHVIPHGVDSPPPNQRPKPQWLRKKHRIPSFSPLIALVGNFYPAKRHLDFLKAAVLIRQAVPEAYFLIAGRCVGNSPAVRRASRRYRKRIEQSVRQLHLQKKVFFSPFFPAQRTSWFRQINLLLSPSDEGFGWAILEAGAAGVPIVSVKEGGAAEILQDGQSGRLVPYGEPPAMAEAAVRILRQPALARRLGQGARRRIRIQYNASNRAGRFSRLYRAILRK